jgi:putative ABC transport system permease protein
MRIFTLTARSLAWYWRTNLAVLLGLASAAGVLGGALLVGQSVRASLRDLVSERLGNVSAVIARSGFVREELAASFERAAGLIALEGVVSHESGGKRAAGVQVFGIDERYWKLQGNSGVAPAGREIVLSAALARELGARAGDSILLRIPKHSAIPLETLHGRKDDTGRTIRLVMKGVADRDFAMRPRQADVRAAYVSLGRLQRDLGQPSMVNAIVTAETEGLEARLRQRVTLADLGVRLRNLEDCKCVSVESDGALISDYLAEMATAAAGSLGLQTTPVLTYLANSLRVRGRQVPYSVVTGIDSELAPSAEDGIVLNDWTARDLGARPGDALELDYYVWMNDGRLHTGTAQFRIDRIVALAGAAADRQLTPDYPGITEARNLRDWDPPFPLDLRRIRPVDEQYWERYRATPKAFVRLGRARQLWGTRFGSLTSLRVSPPSPAFAEALRARLDPAKMGLAVMPVRRQGLEAAQGTTDFGEYFLYFSFFVVVSALLLTGLFFGLGVEQRLSEIGVLRALGFDLSRIRSLFLREGVVLAVAGAALGLGVAVGYGALVMLGLRTWWFDAVHTRFLSLHTSLPALAAGAAGGVAIGLGVLAWTLGRLRGVSPRGLIAGERASIRPARRRAAGAAATVAALALAGASWAGIVDQTGGFFGAGALLLCGTLLLESAFLHARGLARIQGRLTLALRSAAYRPGRSILSIAMIASATFVIVSLDAFRRDTAPADAAGAFSLVADSALPLIHDPGTASGREALGLPATDDVKMVPFRVRPGDDVSCLNLYQPKTPRILGAPASFTRLAGAPWTLLDAPPEDNPLPAIADANSLTYVLHRKVGDVFDAGGVRVRIVAALEDSVFQGELLISEKSFLRAFPEQEGYRFFLLDAPAKKRDEVTRALEEALAGYGFDVQPAAEKLAGFHRVENTYLATFRALGGLGLVLGTLGLGAVLMRNVLERRRELALLAAFGFRRRDLWTIVLAENLFLLLAGIGTGSAAAAVAIAPAIASRGGHLPLASLGVLLAMVIAAGVSASMLATTAALRSPLLAALRSE